MTITILSVIQKLYLCRLFKFLTLKIKTLTMQNTNRMEGNKRKK